ncbi:LysR family transcriptional regulator [Marinomonas sp. C2222]|uniref:LysR family transcriptional regulator n=1 Tax=Marinomonas sargassi TaxID=2984494 RepID=A0ABT2YTS3_9GAMM|nr:LysR family transcriptional regulator [Marinomonas sargassi]MCV2403263.1 LysR family transcriptional regulator [Marinomonas sargassi]
MISNKLITLLPDLAIFILVVEEKSFTAAAKKLGVTPSALSKTISRLEKALSVKLFERTTRRLLITEAGSRIAQQCQTMVNSAQQAVELSSEQHALPAGPITVSAPEAFMNIVLQPLVIPFLKQYPDTQLKLRAVDGPVDIFSQGIDICFQLTDKPNPNLILKEIGVTSLVLCASPEYLASRGTPNHPTQLIDHDCLYLAETDHDNNWYFAKDNDEHTIAVSGRYAVNEAQMRLNGVIDGLGIGIFHDFVARHALEKGEVVEVLSDWTIKGNYHGKIALQYAQNKYLPARFRVFIDYMMEQLPPILTEDR